MGLEAGGRGGAEEKEKTKKEGNKGGGKEKKEKIPHMCESRCPKRGNLLRIQKLSLSSGDS